MGLPTEGSRDVHDGIIVSMVPDICLTPSGGGMVPVPYTIWCRQADAANLANSVRQTDDRSHAIASLVLHCYGDEPGTGGGVNSGTTGAECTPKTWSQTVRAEGRNMVRHTDEWWMNHRNTVGRLIYLKDLNQYNSSKPQQITPRMMSAVKSHNASNSKSQAAQLAQADASAGACPVPPYITIPRPVLGQPILTPTYAAGLMEKILSLVRVSEKKKDGCTAAWDRDRSVCFGLYPKGDERSRCKRGCLERAAERAAICFQTGRMPASPPQWDHFKNVSLSGEAEVTKVRYIKMDISRWSETSDVLNESLEREGSYEATLQALIQCFAATDCGQFSADLNAISLFYPVMLQDETKHAISILFNLAAVVVSYSDALVQSIDRAVAIIADDRIATAWQQSVWRRNNPRV